jgi:hypothetical protein
MSTLLKPNPMGITLTQAKTRLGVSGSADDALLTSLIKAATSRVEGILRRPIRQGKYRDRIEQDYRDETILLPGGGPFAGPAVTSNGGSVSLTGFNSSIGEISIIRGGSSRLEIGALEPHHANTIYETTYYAGWLLDEGAVNDSGELVENFELLSEALTGETEITINAADLAEGSTLPAGATLSIGDELLFVTGSTRDADELEVTVSAPLLYDYSAGAAVAQVDERVPAEIQEEILSLVADSYSSAKGTSVSAPAGVSEVEGDGYRLKFREAGEVDAGIRSRLSRWVVLR